MKSERTLELTEAQKKELERKDTEHIDIIIEARLHELELEHDPDIRRFQLEKLLDLIESWISVGGYPEHFVDTLNFVKKELPKYEDLSRKSKNTTST